MTQTPPAAMTCDPFGAIRDADTNELLMSAPMTKRWFRRELVHRYNSHARLVTALRRVLMAFEADKKISPQMPVIISWETNQQAIIEARAALAAAKEGDQ